MSRRKYDIDMVNGIPTNVSGRTLLKGEEVTCSPEALSAIMNGWLVEELGVKYYGDPDQIESIPMANDVAEA